MSKRIHEFSLDATELSADANATTSRIARVPRVAAARAGFRKVGADRAAAWPLLSKPTLRRTIFAGIILLNILKLISVNKVSITQS